MVNRTELRVLHQDCRSFERLGSILTGGNGWRRDALRLVEIENIGPANEWNPGWPAVFPDNQVAGIVPLFKELVVNDRSGLLTLLHVPTQVESLFKA